MKSKSILITGVCLAAVALCAAPTAFAKGKATPAPAPAAAASPAGAPMAKADHPIPYHGKVTSVDAAAKTFTIVGKTSTRVFKIMPETVIMKQGASATMADIVADEEVHGSYWKKVDGSLEAKKVNLGPKTEAEKAMKKSKKDMSAAPAASPAKP